MLLEPAGWRRSGQLERDIGAPYLEALRAYAAGDPVRLTVPGHKGGAAAPAGLGEVLGEALALDLPALIGGVDCGPSPTPLERALELAAEAWGAARTWFLPHGATQGNLAACLALRAARGREVVVQRNVHSSVVSGLIAAGLAPRWLAPEVDYGAGVAHGVTATALDAALTAAPGARAALVVAPTYHGAVPDVAALAAVAHAHDAALVVDEAWGAHLPFHPALPVDAITAGADLVVSSTHKSLGSLSGSAMLHQGPEAERRLPAAAIDQALGLCASTSPSALALASLDAARARAVEHGERLLDATLRAATAARAQLAAIAGVRVLGPELVGSPGVHGFDPLRLTVDLHDSGRDARAVFRALRRRHGIELEFATDRLLVAVLGIADGELGLAERFAAALLDTLWTIPLDVRRAGPPPPVAPGPAVCTPRGAWLAPQERVPAAAAVGRIATETLSPYPPGIPAVLAGRAAGGRRRRDAGRRRRRRRPRARVGRWARDVRRRRSRGRERMLPLTLAFGASIAWGASDFLGGVASRRLPVVTVLFWAQLAGLVIAAMAWLATGAQLPARDVAALAAAAGLFELIGFAFLFRGLAVGEMSAVAPLAALTAVLPVGVALGAGERVAALEAGGMAARRDRLGGDRRRPGQPAAGPRRRLRAGRGVRVRPVPARARRGERGGRSGGGALRPPRLGAGTRARARPAALEREAASGRRRGARGAGRRSTCSRTSPTRARPPATPARPWRCSPRSTRSRPCSWRARCWTSDSDARAWPGWERCSAGSR